MSLYLWFYILKFAFAMKYSVYNELKGFPDDLRYESMYSNKDTKAHKPSTVNYDIKINGSDNSTAYLVIGSKNDLEEGIFCGDETLIYPWHQGSNLFVKEFNPATVKNLKGTVLLNKTDLYSYFFVSCKYESSMFLEKSNTFLRGEIVFRNPHGFLPAHKKIYVVMYFVLAVIIGILCFYWVKKCLAHKKNLFFYHYCICGILFASLSEIILNLIYYSIANNAGYALAPIYLLSKVLLIARRTLCRVVILLLCSGVGILHENLPSVKKKVLVVLSVFYFFISSLIEIYDDKVFNHEYILSMFFFTFAIISTDFLYFLWIFMALYRTLNEIKETEKFKRKVYTQMSNLTLIGCGIAILFIISNVHFLSAKQYLKPSGWRIYWFHDVGSSEFLFLYFVVNAIIILNPSIEISKYSELLQDDLEGQVSKDVGLNNEDYSDESSQYKSSETDSEEANEGGKEEQDTKEDEKKVENKIDKTENEKEEKESEKKEEESAENVENKTENGILDEKKNGLETENPENVEGEKKEGEQRESEKGKKAVSKSSEKTKESDDDNKTEDEKSVNEEKVPKETNGAPGKKE